MPRRRLLVFGVASIVAVIAIGRAEAANRKFFVARGAGIECADDPDGTTGAPCRRVNESEIAAIETPRTLPENGKQGDGEESPKDEENAERESIDDQTAINEARGKKRKGGYLKVFFMMGAAAKAVMLYAMIHAVALLAGKALVVAKVALALAAAVALKIAFEHQDKTSYEIIKHPHHTYSHTHSASVDYDHAGGGGGGGGHEGGGHRRRRRQAR